MEGKFDVTMDGQHIGILEVKQEGLYCRLSCRCRMVDREVHRLYAGDERLGVLIPENGVLILKSRVPAKRLKDGCAFTLGKSRDNFIPIRPGEVFEHLDKVRQGQLALRDGEPGLIFG